MNLVAAFELVPALLVGSLVWWLAGKSDPPALLTAGTILLTVDLVLRWRRRTGLAPWAWLHARAAGGVLFIFPVWLLGVVQLAVGVARLSGVAL